MCGIFALLNSNDSKKISYQVIEPYFLYGKKRGPEYSKLQEINNNIFFGFHRLAINGLDEISHQPIVQENLSLIFLKRIILINKNNFFNFFGFYLFDI